MIIIHIYKNIQSQLSEYISYQIVPFNLPAGGDYDDDVEAGVEAVEWDYLAVVDVAGSPEYIGTGVVVAAVDTDDD